MRKYTKICNDCGCEFKTSQPKAQYCEVCKAEHRKQTKKKSKVKEAKVVSDKIKSEDDDVPYVQTDEYKAIMWHKNWLRWAKNNGIVGGAEYQATSYALKCILECRTNRIRNNCSQ